jgi:hypothetical protein
MNVLVSGSIGLIGSALVPLLTSSGHRVIRLVRPQTNAEGPTVRWDPAAGTIDQAGLDGVEAVVHLAGENISAGRWTAEQKARIRDSRVKGTRVLCDALIHLAQPPKVMVCSSAIGYYGDRGEKTLTEESASGSGFLPEVCRLWEAATEPAARKGIRVVNLRTGIVLDSKGGALAKMLTPFRLGVGGIIGSGQQYWSWIALDDMVGAVLHALATEGLRGPVNAVAPQPVTNLEFTQVLGRVLSRPTRFPLPAIAARLAFGQMAEELLLASARVQPSRLVATGYQFRFPDLESALRHLLEKQ